MASLIELRTLGYPLKSFGRIFISNTVVSQRNFASSKKSDGPKAPTSASPGDSAVNAPGLSNKVVEVPSTEVGPGASKNATYKNPEYFCYNNTSYFEAEVEMLKYRLPQPSSHVPLSK